jgi:hypothetical protein
MLLRLRSGRDETRRLAEKRLQMVARGQKQDGGDIPPPVDSAASEVEAITHGGLLL